MGHKADTLYQTVTKVAIDFIYENDGQPCGNDWSFPDRDDALIFGGIQLVLDALDEAE